MSTYTDASVRPLALPPWAVALAGPLLIVVTVLFVLHDFVFGGRFSNLNPDVPTVFLVNHCFLGESLQSGHIPAWNPSAMLGSPFIADPQSGWMYLLPMLLYTLLPCSLALRVFIVLQPVIAGLGVYLLLRGEKISRPAATVGGLVLALAMAASKVLVAIPFSDALAWTAVLLPLVGRLLRARTWSSRLLWVLAVAVVWGQIASAHLSHGLVIGTTAAVFYGLYVVRSTPGDTRLSKRALAGTVAVTLLALVVVNLAHLLPVAGYMQRATLGEGYDELQQVAAELRGDQAPKLGVSRALGAIWPLRFATSPGLYLASLPLILMAAGFVARRTRGLAVTFGALGLLFYIAGMKPVIETLAPLISGLPLADFYRHSSGRFVYGALFAAVVLAAIGVDAWRDASTGRARVAMVAPGLLVWGVVPFAAGVFPSRMALFGLGTVAAGFLLYLTARRPSFAWAIPIVVAIELAAGAFAGQAGGIKYQADGLETATDKWLPFIPLPEPSIDAAEYVEGGAIVRTVSDGGNGRLLETGMGLTWMLRPLVSEVEMAQGYNPVQLDRYWRYVRSVVSQPLRYNMSLFPAGLPPEQTLDLFHVGWVGLPPSAAPEAGWERVTTGDKRVLYERDDIPARASLLSRWEVVAGQEAARKAVIDRSFDPGEVVILESDPGLESASEPTGSVETSADLRWATPSRALVEVETEGPAILLVRNAWDVNWRATVDGAPGELLPANYFLQAVPLDGAGRHTVELTYVDPNIGYGLAGTAMGLIVLIGAATTLKLRARTRARDTEEGL